MAKKIRGRVTLMAQVYLDTVVANRHEGVEIKWLMARQYILMKHIFANILLAIYFHLDWLHIRKYVFSTFQRVLWYCR